MLTLPALLYAVDVEAISSVSLLIVRLAVVLLYLVHSIFYCDR